MKKVLIALDYNPSAQFIAEQGYQLAKAMQSEVCLVHVVADAGYYSVDYSPIMGFGGFNTANTIELVEELKKQARQFLSSAALHVGDGNIPTMILEGDTADAILSYADEYKADIIVLGSHSHSGLDTLLMGNVPAKILKYTKKPLFIIPTGQ
ncbi:MAG: universal stress protein [Sphingobacteriales bacterium]|uniref:universal stress protein n=1 Tax=Hydrotalea flava TaxID=714549 RepID=UPI0008353576|nr:universal stress protein [Hydrotalea flava]RTL49976.1 MAG: universal stress protein [Sphingobacteriales bacterium]